MTTASPRTVVVVLVQLAATALAVAAVLVLAVPRLLGWDGVVVLSGSMEPALPVGAVAFVDEQPPDRIEVGDIATFRRATGDSLVTHRVVEVVATPDGPRYRTKGDANGAPDAGLVTPDRVVGTVRFTVPRLGGLAGTLAGNRAALGIVMGAAAAVLIVGDTRRRRETAAPATAAPATAES